MAEQAQRNSTFAFQLVLSSAGSDSFEEIHTLSTVGQTLKFRVPAGLAPKITVLSQTAQRLPEAIRYVKTLRERAGKLR